jgi:hypothetical protein
MTAPMTDTGGLDVEYVPDSGPAPAPEVVDGGQPLIEYTPTVELRGKRFPVSDNKAPLLSMMKLATIAKRTQGRPPGTPPDPRDEMESMSIMYELLQSCIAEEAWGEFEEHANRVGAGVNELQQVIAQTTAARANRPTQPSSGSPGGRSTTAPNSAESSSPPEWSGPIQMGDYRVQQREEARGRPDRALVVQRAREAWTRSSTG